MQLRLSLALLLLCTAASATAQTISLPPEPAANTRAPKPLKAESVSLVGTLGIIPMGSAQVVLRSNNFGQITLLPQTELSAADLSQVERWESQRTQVKVQGTMLTICAERDLKRDIMGCRLMDRSKTMTLVKE